MSVLIKGMEMPKTPLLVCIYPNGICSDEEGKTYRAVSVPPHGRLIDADALREEVKKHATPSDAWVFSLIRTAPTIIPSDKDYPKMLDWLKQEVDA